MSLFRQAIAGENKGRPPIWMMRQAGRYHAHYQAMKQKHTFLELCRTPELACEVTMGPIRDFDFDAAILFSDILFPLEILGVPLDFAPGPQLGFLLQSKDDLARYTQNPDVSKLKFQADALRLIRIELSPEKGLIGFVGGMLTLYVFAVHGTHKTELDSARAGFHDGRFDAFMEMIMPVMLQNMILQARENIDALAIFESCAGDIDIEIYKSRYFPYLKQLLTQFKQQCPNTPIIYYGKDAGPAYWELIKDLPVQVLGIDHHQPIETALPEWSEHFSIQGNFDPNHLTLEPETCEKLIRAYFKMMYAEPPETLQKWICGTGHGLIPTVREENVHKFIQLAREMWKD